MFSQPKTERWTRNVSQGKYVRPDFLHPYFLFPYIPTSLHPSKRIDQVSYECRNVGMQRGNVEVAHPELLIRYEINNISSPICPGLAVVGKGVSVIIISDRPNGFR